MKHWKGLSIMLIAIVHTIFSFVFFTNDFMAIWRQGIYNSINTAQQGLAIWFFIAGMCFFMIGQFIWQTEKNGNTVAKSISIHLLVMTTLGVILLPQSGFWLLFPAIFALLFSRRASHKQINSPVNTVQG